MLNFRAVGDLLRLYRVVSGGCRRQRCQHRDVVRADVEIVFMLVIPLLFRRLGVKIMLLIGMLAWFVRYAFLRWASARGAHPALSGHSAARRLL